MQRLVALTSVAAAEAACTVHRAVSTGAIVGLCNLQQVRELCSSSGSSESSGMRGGLEPPGRDRHSAGLWGASDQVLPESLSGGSVNLRHFSMTSSSQQAFLPQVFGQPPPLDPFALVKDELESVSERLRRSLSTNIPALGKAAGYFFQLGAEGKRLRPTMLLLMASALSPLQDSGNYLTVDERPPNVHPTEERRRQQRIAEITEMIHVASLLHDDVIDDSATRRGLKALNLVFGNKIAILAGDFLLARASVSLAALRNTQVVELLSEVIEHLVSGEILQMTSSKEELVSLDTYIQKTFYKTASLMANSCKAVAILGGHPKEIADLAYDYGRHVGLAFQFIDDVLDFTGSLLQLGKPALNDLRSGLATAPVLYAAEEFPDLKPLILRRFGHEGDVAYAQQMVAKSAGIQRTRDLAATHARLASEAVGMMPPVLSPHAALCRQALQEMTQKVLTRKK